MFKKIKKILPFQRKKVGLALGSGGVKGLAHVGVIKTLCKYDIPIDFIAGTSIGSWVGAHYAIFQDIDRLEEFTIGKKKEKLQSFLDITWKGGLIKGKKVEKLIEEWLEDADFKSTKIPVKIIATELITGEEIIFSEGKISPAVRASISVPSIFSPFKYNDKILVDGGLCNPVPTDIVREMGADIVISVNLNNYRLDGIFNNEDIKSLPKVTGRSIDLLRHYLAKNTVKKSDIIIEPLNTSEDLSKWKNYFKYDIGEKHLKLGIESTEKVIPQILTLLNK